MVRYDTSHSFLGERFAVTYRISQPYEEAKKIAELLVVEQTIEFPSELVGKRIKSYVIGRIESMQYTDRATFVKVSYSVEITGNELTQFFNVVMGNVSLIPGIKVVDLELSPSLKSFLPGPRFGVEGLREILGVKERPLIATAIKPMGLTSEELAEMAYKLAKGGVDIIKDDHGLADQDFSPFAERVSKVLKAVDKANQETGGKTLYAPNVTANESTMMKRALIAKEMGVKALLVAPALVGFGSVQLLSQEVGLPILSHPAFLGGYLSIATHRVLFGLWQRLIGADVSIFPNHGGRFTFSLDECRESVRGTHEPFAWLRPILPSPAGGMSVDKVKQMVNLYGNDVLLLIGGALHRMSADLEKSARIFKEEVERARL
ncbi:MAG: S-methyl-5-thioribulose 1-phosphate isomerase [Thermotogota bacterium]|nr:S-methyl-5-thioribulose 1-phosphate isomerase [Thermotogota bacterium]MDK2865014.1 S-methyl-5-thioribulose 1-phosphate isomerase [Thermotogota bacterium]HCZ07400.1 ribulose 1,5-bisphosphate carboxylase large subunit [Thermotogota bacterium]